MTARVIVSCDADWYGMPCRGALPVNTVDPVEYVDVATGHGWSHRCDPDGSGDCRDLCPAHARLAEDGQR